MLEYDQYGQPYLQLSVAVPRGRNFRVSEAACEPYLAKLEETTYANRDDDRKNIVDRIARTTSYEIINDGDIPDEPRPSVFRLLHAVKEGVAKKSIIGQTVNFYDGPAFRGLPFCQIGDQGALVRTETLILTEDILNEAYPKHDTIPTPSSEPPYFAYSGTPEWPDEYPAAFVERYSTSTHEDSTRPDLAITPIGLGFSKGNGSPYACGYFTPILRQSYDFQDGSGREGLLTTICNPIGRDGDLHITTINYEDKGLSIDVRLLPTLVTDPAVLTTQAEYDYRTLKLKQVTDPNGNRTAFGYTPIGLLAYTAVMGKDGEAKGDTTEVPGSRFNYYLLAFMEAGTPISIHTIQREHHANDTDVSLPKRDDTFEIVEYSDGFGRLLQTRSQAENVLFGDSIFGANVLPSDQRAIVETQIEVVGRLRASDEPPNVVVSGWQMYDNKGRVVEKYEPFFSSGWAYAPPIDLERGQKIEFGYDPRGRLIKTINPNGSNQCIFYGVPGAIDDLDLSDPESFEPTPWESYTYDENDNAGRTHPDDAYAHLQFLNTPSSRVIDALGRTVASIERTRTKISDGTWSPNIDDYRIESSYDIQGNLHTILDSLGREAISYTFDLTPKSYEMSDSEPHVLRIRQIDSGISRQ
jgi:hypothetical protein